MNHNPLIADLDWQIERTKRQLRELVERNDCLEAELKPANMRLLLGREQEEELKGELIRLANEKMKLGWKSHEPTSA